MKNLRVWLGDQVVERAVRQINPSGIESNPIDIVINGTIVAIEDPGTMIWDTLSNKEWHAIRFVIQTERGERYRTLSYPDQTRPEVTK